MTKGNSVVIDAGSKFKGTHYSGWHCAHCHRKTTFEAPRLIRKRRAEEPDMGMVIVSHLLFCNQCFHRLERQ